MDYWNTALQLDSMFHNSPFIVTPPFWAAQQNQAHSHTRTVPKRREFALYGQRSKIPLDVSADSITEGDNDLAVPSANLGDFTKATAVYEGDSPTLGVTDSKQLPDVRRNPRAR